MGTKPIHESEDEAEPILFRNRGDSSATQSQPAVRRTRSRRIETDIQAAIDRDQQQSLDGDESFWAKLYTRFRPGFFLDHLDKDSLIVVFRSWLHLWIIVIITVIGPAYRWLGMSLIVANVTAIIDPLGFDSIMTALHQGFFTALFITYCYLHRVVSSAIIYQLHGRPTKELVLGEIYASGECPLNDEFCAQEALLDGRFLTLRTTTITIFSVLICLTLLGYFSSKHVFLKIPYLFSMIVTIFMTAAGNHIPWFEPTRDFRATILPVFIAEGAKVCLSVLAFPRTSNERCVKALITSSRVAHEAVSEMFDKMGTMLPSHDNFLKDHKQFVNKAVATIQPLTKLEFELRMAKFEPVFSRIHYSDLLELVTRMRALMSSCYNFGFFFVEFKERSRLALETEKELECSPEILPSRRFSFEYVSRRTKRPWLKREKSVHYMQSSAFERRRQEYIGHLHTDDIIGQDVLDQLYSAIFERYIPLLRASQGILEQVYLWIAEANNNRLLSLFHKSKRRRNQELRRDRLQEAVEEMEAVLNKVLALTTLPGIDTSTFNKEQMLYVLQEEAFYSFLCQEYAQKSHEVAKWCMLIDKTQPAPSFCVAFLSTKSTKRSFHMAQQRNQDIFYNDPPDAKAYEPLNIVQARNADSTPPQNAYHRLGASVLRLKKQIFADNLLISFKRAGAVVIPAILYFTRPTLHFANAYRLTWVSILANMTIAERPADTVHELLLRTIFTITGGLVGMIAWYMSTGNGDGNPYGYSTVFAVICVPLAFYRHFNVYSLPLAGIIFGLTCFLVAATSWTNTHVPQPGVELGKGFHVFWIRVVCVIVGNFIGFLISLFPEVRTGKKAARLIHGACLRNIGHALSELVNFTLQRYDDPRVHTAPAKDTILARIHQTYSYISTLSSLQATLWYEPPLTGFWPKHHYDLLLGLHREIMHALSFFQTLIDTMVDTERIPDLLKQMGWTNPRLLSGTYAVLFMSQRAIVTGEPLPSVTPGRLSEEYHDHLCLLGVQDPINVSPQGGYARRSDKSIFVGVKLAQLLYERFDGVILLIKGLVGEYYDTDPRLFDWDLEDGL